MSGNKAEIDKLKNALNKLINLYIGKRGEPKEYLREITYTLEAKYWKAWNDARNLLGEKTTPWWRRSK